MCQEADSWHGNLSPLRYARWMDRKGKCHMARKLTRRFRGEQPSLLKPKTSGAAPRPQIYAEVHENAIQGGVKSTLVTNHCSHRLKRAHLFRAQTLIPYICAAQKMWKRTFARSDDVNLLQEDQSCHFLPSGSGFSYHHDVVPDRLCTTSQMRSSRATTGRTSCKYPEHYVSVFQTRSTAV